MELIWEDVCPRLADANSNEVFQGVKTRQHGAETQRRSDDDGEDVAQPLKEA
jgi:hypothetical protein